MLAILSKSEYNSNIAKTGNRRVGANPTLTWYKGRSKLSKIEDKVEDLLKEKIENLGYDLYDVQYSKEGKNYFLRIFIDKPTGIDLNDCEKVNDEINDILDEANYIKDAYFLEVSSPGIERVLRKNKHLKQNIGEKVGVKLFKKDKNNQKEYIGILKNFTPQEITIESEDGKEIKIERKDITQIKTIYDW